MLFLKTICVQEVLHYPASPTPCKDSPCKAPSGLDEPLQIDQNGHGPDDRPGGELEAPEIPPSQDKEVAEVQSEQPAPKPTGGSTVDLMDVEASCVENNT